MGECVGRAARSLVSLAHGSLWLLGRPGRGRAQRGAARPWDLFPGILRAQQFA